MDTHTTSRSLARLSRERNRYRAAERLSELRELREVGVKRHRLPDGPRPSGETLLGSLAHERHTRVFEGTPTGPPFTAAPPGFRAEDMLGTPELEGYVTIPEAAERMGITEEEVVGLVARFALAYQVVGRTVYVRPAIVEG